jgi:tetratricopeptide (TPR) repeat protein
MKDSITHSQTTKTKAAKGQAKWLALALLAVLLTAIIVVHFSSTPATTRADNKNVADEFGFVPLQEQRDLGKAEAYYNRGVRYCKAGAFDLAISDFNKAIEINPRDAAAYCARGDAYGKEGAHDLAISDLNKAIEINPDFADAYFTRGFAYAEEGAHGLATSDYTKAIEINPAFAGAYCNRGVEYNVKGQHDLAISDFNKAIEINPKEGQHYYYRGVTYAAKDEFDKAWKDVHKAQDLGYQVSPEFIEQLSTAIVLKRKLGPDFPQHTPRTPAPRPNTPKIDPHKIIDTKLKQLASDFKNEADAYRESRPDPREYNAWLRVRQAQYDQDKAKLIEIQSQFKLIDDLVKSGQMDSDAGYKAKMELAVPKAVFDAMFP